ncbi:MAG TPA: Rrf2 family transcriptional regulator [Oculatellaceae cyanobacterium]
MISQTAEYALRAVVYLAEASQGGQTTEQIARATQIPPAYLSKVLQQLSKASVVQSQRGLRGGFSLKPKPNKLTVLAVVNAVDPIERIKECPLGLDAHAIKLCPLHRRLDEANALVERAFASTTISELVADPKSSNIFTFSTQKTIEEPPPSKKSQS